jgi:spermidine synthase
VKDCQNQIKDHVEGAGCEPFVLEGRKFISLRFDHDDVQSPMDVDDPIRLVVNYTQSIMGFTLFNTSPKKIAMIGLGGGSLSEYCRHHSPNTHMLVINNNPKLIEMRDQF